VRKELVETKEYDRFPMISYEHTRDSIFEVEISESKFLNDLSHIGTWIMGTNEDELIFILNLKSKGDILEIDAFEIRDELRGQGLGSNILAVIESVAEQYYNAIAVSPFDTDAQNFWECMEYEEWRDGYLIKQLNV
jgi:GNAT superfamily N-acetyltransferase